jgi:hypothetical protein
LVPLLVIIHHPSNVAFPETVQAALENAAKKFQKERQAFE